MRTAIRFHPLPSIGRPVVAAIAVVVAVEVVDGGLFLAGHLLYGNGADPYRAAALVLLGTGMAATAMLVARLTADLWMYVIDHSNTVARVKDGMHIQPSRARR